MLGARRGGVTRATSLTRARPCEAPPGSRSESPVARTCIRKMADSGDGVTSTSSGKEARGTIADGPITDPASSMKVNRAGLRSNLKPRAVPRAPSDVRANLTALCHDCRICRRSHDGDSIGERGLNARSTSPSTVLPASTRRSSCRYENFSCSSYLPPLYLRQSLRVFLSFSFVSLSPLPRFPRPTTVSLLVPHLYFFCLARLFRVL